MRIKDITGQLPKGQGSYEKRSIEAITDIVVHHSASSPNTTPEQIAQWHTEGNGWPGIGYHYEIGADGTIYQTNAHTTVSWHNEGKNTYCLGVCLVGNFDIGKPTQKQLDSLYWLLKRLVRELPSVEYIKGHGQYKSTSCPGKNLDMDLVRLKVFGRDGKPDRGPRALVWAVLAVGLLLIGGLIYLRLRK